MTSVDWAAAERRVRARREARALEASARLRESENRNATTANARLPLPAAAVGTRALNIWDRVKGRTGTNPTFRVGQVDAELLDEELLGLLKSQAGEALKYLNVGPFRYTETLSRKLTERSRI